MAETHSTIERMPFSDLKRILVRYLYDENIARMNWMVSFPFLIYYTTSTMLNFEYNSRRSDFLSYFIYHPDQVSDGDSEDIIRELNSQVSINTLLVPLIPTLYLFLLEINKIRHLKWNYLRRWKYDVIFTPM